MDEGKIKHHMDMLGESIEEILDSAAAVRGPQFANAACLSFEACQMSEILGTIANMAPDEHQKRAHSLGAAGLEVIASMLDKAFGDLSDELSDEALAMGAMLHKRRMDAVDRLNRDLNGASD